jgi:hypothetical protein
MQVKTDLSNKIRHCLQKLDNVKKNLTGLRSCRSESRFKLDNDPVEEIAFCWISPAYCFHSMMDFLEKGFFFFEGNFDLIFRLFTTAI